MPKRIAFLTTLGAVLILAAGASAKQQYTLKHPKREHCKTHYVKRSERLRRQHHRRLIVRKVVCIYIAPKEHKHQAAITAPPRTVALSAHLDPSFVQSLADPLAVTYSYSASATATTAATTTTTTEPTPLPAGILNLYSDGALACSSPVGGEKTGGECPVTYKASGAHQVIVTYVAGSTLATETYTETVEPYSTHTTETVGEPVPNTFGGYGSVRYIGGKVEDQHGYALGGEVTYTIKDEATGATKLQFTKPVGAECYIHEYYSRSESGVGEYWFYGAGTCAEKGFEALRTDKIIVVAEYAGSPGYTPSASESTALQ